MLSGCGAAAKWTAAAPVGAAYASTMSRELLSLRVLTVAVVAAGCALCAVRVVADPAVTTPATLAVVVTMAATAVCIGLMSWVGYAVRPLPADLPEQNARAVGVRQFVSASIVRLGLAHAPVVVAFLCSVAFVPHSWLVLLVGLPASLVMVALHAWPSRRTAQATAEVLDSAGGRSHLVQVLQL